MSDPFTQDGLSVHIDGVPLWLVPGEDGTFVTYVQNNHPIDDMLSAVQTDRLMKAWERHTEKLAREAGYKPRKDDFR